MDHHNAHLRERCNDLLPALPSRLHGEELPPICLQIQSPPKIVSHCGLKPLTMLFGGFNSISTSAL